MDENELLTIPQVAKKLQVNEMTIRRWINQGKLESIRLGEKLLRIDPKALNDFIRGRKSKPTEKPTEKPEDKSQRESPASRTASRAAGEYLSTPEVARLAGLKTDTVTKLASKGQLPARKKSKFWIFEKAAIDEWLAKREGTTPEDQH